MIAILCIRQNRLLNKDYSKRQKLILYKNKRFNTTIAHNPCSIYAPNIGAPKYIKQTLIVIKVEINSYTITVGDYNTP